MYRILFWGLLSHSIRSRRIANAKQRMAVYIRRTGKNLDTYAYIPYVKERVEKMTAMKNAHDYHTSSLGRRTNHFVALPISQASGTF